MNGFSTRSKWLLGAGLALLAHPSSHAQVTPSGGAYLLRMKFVKGATSLYNLETITSDPRTGKPQRTTVPMSMTVTAAKGATGTMKVKVGPIPGSNRVQESVITLDARGKMVKGEAGMTGVSSVALPEKPIKLGSTWQNQVQVNTPLGALTTNTVYKLHGFKVVNNRKVAVINVTTKAAKQGITIDGKGAMSLVMADGSLNGMFLSQTITIEPKMSSPGATIKTKVVVVRTN